MFRKDASIDMIQSWAPGTLVETLGIEFTEIGNNYLCAKMPVDHRTVQPMGILHGGASLALAETIGSVGSTLIVDLNTSAAVGLEINGNHIRSCTKGFVHAKATAVHIGRKTHVWDIRIKDDEGKLVCISRITMAVISK